MREHGTIFARKPIRKYHLKYMAKQNEIETKQQWSLPLPISLGVYRMLIFESWYRILAYKGAGHASNVRSDFLTL